MRTLMLAADAAWHAVGGPRHIRLPVSTATAAAASSAQAWKKLFPTDLKLAKRTIVTSVPDNLIQKKPPLKIRN